MKILLSVLLLSFTFLPLAVMAQEETAVETVEGPTTETIEYVAGSSIPTDVTLQDQNDETQILRNLYGDKGMVLVFYRSADWCPYCMAQLINLKAHSEDIADMGYSIVGISYDDVETLGEFSKRYKIGYELLSDPESATIKRFGIFNDTHKEGSFAYGVPHPTIYIVQKDGVIKAVLTEEGYKKRPEVSDIKAAIKK